jgi:hypothetical protein
MVLLRRLVRLLRRLAVAGALGAVAVAVLLAEDGVSTGDWILAALLLAPAAIVLLFAQAVAEVGAIPERVRRVPAEGGERVSELSRLASEARTARMRNVPFLLWRLRGSVGGLRDIAGVALPLKAFTPGFVGVAAIAAFACVALVPAGVIALVALAV